MHALASGKAVLDVPLLQTGLEGMLSVMQSHHPGAALLLEITGNLNAIPFQFGMYLPDLCEQLAGLDVHVLSCGLRCMLDKKVLLHIYSART